MSNHQCLQAPVYYYKHSVMIILYCFCSIQVWISKHDGNSFTPTMFTDILVVHVLFTVDI